jgi:hypothetical protein
MRQSSLVLGGLVLAVTVGLAHVSAAQPVTPPTIHRVTLHPDTGVLTVTGTGLGPDLQVTVDGQPVPQLPGASNTQMEVLAPVTVVTQPGTYRLTVADVMRRVGDGFVVVSPARGVVTESGAAPIGSPGDAAGGAPRQRARGPAAVNRAAARLEPGGIEPYLIENGLLGNTAVGVDALLSNTTGYDNTASGAAALFANTTGYRNTASGRRALYFNTSWENTATGFEALYSNTGGAFNTASGSEALRANTTGSANTAVGVAALRANTTGGGNTAVGAVALPVNITGSENTAIGWAALWANTTGSQNTASGRDALLVNSTGSHNTAAGFEALYWNSAGNNNTASGSQALFNTTGNANAAFGVNAGQAATTGSYNVFLGANVVGTAADTNTIRIGLPFNAGVGQNQTFIAGIWGTQLTGTAAQVMIDANGQLGIGTPVAILNSGAATTMAPAGVEQRLHEQQAAIAELRTENAAQQTTIAEMRQRSQAQQATIDDLLARLTRLETTSRAVRRP